jgi:16S rRNA (cytidine1402-2'-O)-methyltransferase
MMTDHTSIFGKVYLIPTPLVMMKENTSIPEFTIQAVHQIKHFCVENLKTAVSFITWVKHPEPEYNLHFYELTKRTSEVQIQEYLTIALNGEDVGVLTDAGCPGVADPGADLVKMAHHFDIEVVPLTGPSSPLLALMASGLGGQKFAFQGYLPVKAQAREKEIRELEERSATNGSTELFMETPHRNLETFKHLLAVLKNDTMVSVSANLTMPDAVIKSREVSDWKHRKAPEIDKIPAIFGIKAKDTQPSRAIMNRKPVKKKFGK